MIVAGFGFRASATVGSLRSALRKAQGTHAPDCLATLADKADKLEVLAQELGLAFKPITAQQIENMETSTMSGASLKARETGSVAEATALAAAGQGAKLLGTRQISDDRMATCALARGATL
jgi:cobalt-precorrin 5A hydrolase